MDVVFLSFHSRFIVFVWTNVYQLSQVTMVSTVQNKIVRKNGIIVETFSFSK